jgi:SAM-dependent methyltransferase
MPQNSRSAQMPLGQSEKTWRADPTQPGLAPATQFLPACSTPAALAAHIRRQVALEQYVDPALADGVLRGAASVIQGKQSMLTAERPPTASTPSPPIHGTHAPRTFINWNELNATLNLAEHHAPVGTTLPEMARFRGFKRRIARFIGRIVLTLTRVITGQQRVFNHTLLNASRDMVESLRQLEQAHRAAFHRLELDMNQRLDQLEKTQRQLRTSLPLQERRVSVLLEEVRRRLPGPLTTEQLQAMVREENHLPDALYVAFEDQFRGSREEIKERLHVYLPYLQDAGIGTEKMPILDVGCGRGEWLELLRDQGLHATGLDLNRALVSQCRHLGLQVAEGDVLTHLRTLPDSSLGGLTGFHIIEHLPFTDLLKLFDEAARVLKPGGMMIFETPNPENMLVGSCYFYVDPTHRNPLYPQTVQFLAEQRGLVRVDILRVNKNGWAANTLEPAPPEYPLAPQLNALIELVTTRFFAAPDFAVLARKA